MRRCCEALQRPTLCIADFDLDVELLLFTTRLALANLSTYSSWPTEHQGVWNPEHECNRPLPRFPRGRGAGTGSPRGQVDRQLSAMSPLRSVGTGSSPQLRVTACRCDSVSHVQEHFSFCLPWLWCSSVARGTNTVSATTFGSAAAVQNYGSAITSRVGN